MTSISPREMFCFVCDIAVSNKYFSLATCRTQSSKKKLIEKLGHLVGDGFMVVITEEDVICRSCANLMNTLDRLEFEMASVKRVVLRFLERKYQLDEGVLLQTTTAQPKVENADPESFILKKQKANEAESQLSSELEKNKDDPRSKIWMQCNSCQYTTNYTSFVNNHIRNNVCLYCEEPLKDGSCPKNCEKYKILNETSKENGVSPENGPSPETVLDVHPLKPDSIEVPLTLDEFDDGNLVASLNEANSVLYNESVYSNEETEGDEKQVYLRLVDSEESTGVRQQVYAVAGDGSVEMMEVLWNDDDENGVSEVQFD